MKKKFALLLMVVSLLCVNTEAQKKSGVKNKNTSSPIVDSSFADSLPVLGDSTYFVSNADLATVQKIMKTLMSKPEYLQADGITQYEVLIANLNQVFIAARRRWEQENKNLKVK